MLCIQKQQLTMLPTLRFCCSFNWLLFFNGWLHLQKHTEELITKPFSHPGGVAGIRSHDSIGLNHGGG